MPLPASSPFQPIAATSPPPVAPAKADPQAQVQLQLPRPNDAISRKENTSPNSKTYAATVDAKLKPSSAWNSINAPAAGKRTTSMMDKAGNEVGVDRLEAARARIAARGRVVS